MSSLTWSIRIFFEKLPQLREGWGIDFDNQPPHRIVSSQLPPSPQDKPSTQVSHLHPSPPLLARQNTFHTLPRPLHTSRHSKSLSVYLFLYFKPQLSKSKEFIYQIQKERVKGLLKAILFCHQNNKKADRFMKFSSILSTDVQRCLNRLFEN